MKCGTLVEICLWPHLAVKGLMSFQIDFLIFLFFFCFFVDFFFLQIDRTRKNDHNQLFTTLQYTTEKKNYPFVKPNVYYFTVGSAVG